MRLTLPGWAVSFALITSGKMHDGAVMEYRIESGTDDPHAPLILCLHGQGMNEDWFALLLQKLFSLPAHFLIPRAPTLLSARTGRPEPSWYEYDGDQERFLRELTRVEEELLDFLATSERERGLDPRARVLLGFSQGGYAAAHVALRHPEIFSGLIVSGARVKTEMPGWHANPEASGSLPQPGTSDARGLQVLLCHGRKDRVVLPEAAERSHRELAATGIAVTTQTFGTGHVIGREQVAAIASWLRTHFL